MITLRMKSNSGASMLYVLAALIVTAFISGALIKMTSSDKTSNALYKTSASARVTAKSGMIAATSCLQLTKVPVGHANHGAFYSDSAFVMGLLSDWITPATIDANHRYIPEPPTGLTAGDFIPLVPGAGANSPRYRVEVLAFDPAERNILLRSEGIGKGGSRATMTSVFNLDGLGFATYSDWTDQNAIHIEDDIKLEIRAPITIDGASRFSKNTEFDGWASGSIFKGSFRTQEAAAHKDSMIFMGSYTFEDKCFFGIKPYWTWTYEGINDFNAHVTIKGKAGFPKGSLINERNIGDKSSYVDLQQTSFWKYSPDPMWNSQRRFHRFNNNNFVYSGASAILGGIIPQSRYIKNDKPYLYPYYDTTACKYVLAPVTTQLTSDNILDSLDFEINPCDVEIDLNAIPTGNIHYITTEKEWGANDFDAFAGDAKDWNGFTVISTSAKIKVYGGVNLQSNVILIIEPGGAILPGSTGKMFSVENADQGKSGGHFTIINNGGDVGNIGGWSNFRGLFYNINGKMHVGGSKNSGVINMYGAIYANNANSDGVKWEPLAELTSKPAAGALTYDPTVYEQLEALGIVSKTGIDCDNPQEEDFTKLKLVGDRLRTSLVSQSL